MTVEALKEAIAELAENDRHSLAAWLNELEFDQWDRQMVERLLSWRTRHGFGWRRVRRDIAARAKIILWKKVWPKPDGINRTRAH